MKKLLLLLLFVPILSFGQDYKLNGFKYAIVHNIKYDGVDMGVGVEEFGAISSALNSIGIKTFKPKDNHPEDLINNDCLAVYVQVIFYRGGGGQVPAYFSKLNFTDCTKNLVTTIELRHQRKYMGALKKVLNKFIKINYSFNSSLTPVMNYPEVENISIEENSYKDYLESNLINPMEGIFKTYQLENSYKLGIIKNKDTFKGVILDSELKQWKKGDVKAIFESTAVDGVYTVQYFLSDKTSIETFANVEGGLITIEFDDVNKVDANIRLLRIFPK